MRKIPTLFVRDFDNDPRWLTREVHPDCKWVIDGEGIATRKYDGTCVMWDGERWWARREIKPGRTAPAGFVEVEHDDETGKTVGWEPASQSGYWRWHAEALGVMEARPGFPGHWPLGTYELIGPKINGNPEGEPEHVLLLHEHAVILSDVPRGFDVLAAWLHAHEYEGIVWHHPDGRMAKIKRRDFPR